MGKIYDATWGRVFTELYDRLMKRSRRRRPEGDQAGGPRRCHRSHDRHRAGTGANLPLYPAAVSELVLAEPDPHMLRKLHPKVADSKRSASVVQAPAERLPFEDDGFDTAVFTLVLCTAPDPAAALAEAARVLRPGGRLLFVEHVRSESPGLARWQDRLETPWRLFGDGCHCNRDTVATIEASPFAIESVEHDHMPKAPPLVRPLVRGSATLAG